MEHTYEIAWPPPVGVPYLVEDALGSWTEMVLPGAYADAVPLDAHPRTFVVSDDEWSEDFSERRIRRISAISVS